MSASNVVKLTNAVVEAIKCPPDRPNVLYWDKVLKGFGVRVNAAGTIRTYVLLYRVKGSRQERQVKIGRHNDPWRTDNARERAQELKMQMLAGVDPVLQAQEKEAARAVASVKTRAETITLQEVLESYLRHRKTARGALRDATKVDIERHANSNLGDWLDEPVANITRDLCVERFDAIAERSESQAAQCFAYLRALLNHARDLLETEDGQFPLFAVNPVQRMFRLRKPAPEAPRDTRIPLDRVRAVWQDLSKWYESESDLDTRTRIDWVRLILLTGARRRESGSLLWSNVDFDGGTIHFPGEVTKNGVDLTLPMSTQMRELLRRRHGEPSPYVFANRFSTEGHMLNAPEQVLERVSHVADTRITLHDGRRTFTDVAAEVGVRPDRERMLLNHKTGDVHARHYSNAAQHALRSDIQRIADWICSNPV